MTFKLIRMAELRARGVPEKVLEHSGQDGLRWFEDTYGAAMAMSDWSLLANAKEIPEEEIEKAIENCFPAYLRLGEYYGKTRALRLRHRPEPEPDATQMEFEFAEGDSRGNHKD